MTSLTANGLEPVLTSIDDHSRHNETTNGVGSSSDDIPVLIVGAGPTGLFLSHLISQLGGGLDTAQTESSFAKGDCSSLARCREIPNSAGRPQSSCDQSAKYGDISTIRPRYQCHAMSWQSKERRILGQLCHQSQWPEDRGTTL